MVSANSCSATDIDSFKDLSIKYLLSYSIQKLTNKLEMSDYTICHAHGHVVFTSKSQNYYPRWFPEALYGMDPNGFRLWHLQDENTPKS